MLERTILVQEQKIEDLTRQVESLQRQLISAHDLVISRQQECIALRGQVLDMKEELSKKN